MNNSETNPVLLRPGDKVYWAGKFGKELYQEAVVQEIERLVREGTIYGRPVSEVAWDDIDGYVVVLTNGTWAYGYQLLPFWTPAKDLNVCHAKLLENLQMRFNNRQ